MFCTPTSRKETAVKRLLVVLVGSLLCCMSCGSDDEPIPGGPSGSPPRIANLECIPPSAPAEGTGSITIDCSLFFRDQDGDLEAIIFSYIQGCGQNPGDDYFDVSDQSGVQQQGDIELKDLIIATTCSIGTYTYGFTAVDRKKNESPVEILGFELF